MPGTATAQLLNYATVVDVDMDQTNDVNLADVEDYGHRVQVEISKSAVDAYLGWTRAAGAARPSASLNTAAEAAFLTAIEAALADSYVDVDGVVDGLNFSTSVLSTNTDSRIRKNGAVSANDIPLAFVLYKLYGNSAAATLDTVYNLEDAHEMLSNSSVSAAINSSLKAQVAGSLDVMFRDLLAADPHRFFDASGIPVTGIFETKTDIAGSGTWNITNNDIIEVKTKLIFNSKVTRRGVAGNESNITSTDGSSTQNNQQTIISPGDYFYIRLQMKAATI